MKKMPKFGFIILVPIVFIISFLLVSLFTKEPVKAYDFTTGTSTGEVISLYDNLGKQNTALIFFDPEVEGSNQVMERLAKRKDKIDVIAISVSSMSQDKQMSLIPGNAKEGIKLCFVAKDVVKKYNVGNAPVVHFIDKEGYVKKSFIGALKQETIDKQIDKMA